MRSEAAAGKLGACPAGPGQDRTAVGVHTFVPEGAPTRVPSEALSSAPAAAPSTEVPMDTVLSSPVRRHAANPRAVPATLWLLLVAAALVVGIVEAVATARGVEAAGPSLTWAGVPSSQYCDPFGSTCTSTSVNDFETARILGKGFTPGGSVRLRIGLELGNVAVLPLEVRTVKALSKSMLAGTFKADTDYRVDCGPGMDDYELVVTARDLTSGALIPKLEIPICA